MGRNDAHPKRKARAKGFTLLELMIVVAIIAILTAIAYPSYRQHVIKARRAAATGCLLEQSQLMERYYTTNLTYLSAPAPGGGCASDLVDSYAFAFDGTPTAKEYKISATPTSIQTDSQCGTLSVTQAGVRDKTGTGTVAQCW